MDARLEIESALGQEISDLRLLSGGCVAQVYSLKTTQTPPSVLADISVHPPAFDPSLAVLDPSGQPHARKLVAKIDDGPTANLDLEAYMLRYLARFSELPVPEVLFVSPHLLLLSWLPGESKFSPAAQEHAASLLAALHAVVAPQFGLELDTLIGGLPQPNKQTDTWLEFFRDNRLLAMAVEAARAGRLPRDLLSRLERLATRLGDFLLEPSRPSLLHGDVWITNVLAAGSRITGFLDPAIYYGHPEIELAFVTLFGTFGKRFFERYHELRPISPGFFETRRDIYNLYPLLVHCRLFGGSYVTRVESILDSVGF